MHHTNTTVPRRWLLVPLVLLLATVGIFTLADRSSISISTAILYKVSSDKNALLFPCGNLNSADVIAGSTTSQMLFGRAIKVETLLSTKNELAGARRSIAGRCNTANYSDNVIADVRNRVWPFFFMSGDGKPVLCVEESSFWRADQRIALTLNGSYSLDFETSALRVADFTIFNVSSSKEENTIAVPLLTMSPASPNHSCTFHFNEFTGSGVDNFVIDAEKSICGLSVTEILTTTTTTSTMTRTIEQDVVPPHRNPSPDSFPRQPSSSAQDPDLTRSTSALQGASIVASTVIFCFFAPSLSFNFGIARQQALINLVQNVIAASDARIGSCAGVHAFDEVPAADSPLQLRIGESESQLYVGGVLGNFLMSFLLVVFGGIFGAFIRWKLQSPNWNTPFAVLARCYMGFILCVCSSLLLAPTVKFSLVALTLSDVTMGKKILVVIFSLVGFVIPTFCYAIWSLFLRSNTKLEQYRTVPRQQELEKETSKVKKLLTYWFECEGEWMMPAKASLEENLQFDAASPLFEGYNERAKWFGLVEFIVMLGLAFAPFIGNIVPKEKSCATVCIVLLITLGVFLLLCLYFRPFNHQFMRFSVPFITMHEIIVISVAYAHSDDNLTEPVARVLSILATLTSSQQLLVVVMFLIGNFSLLQKMILILKRERDDKNGDEELSTLSEQFSTSAEEIQELLEDGSKKTRSDPVEEGRNLEDLLDNLTVDLEKSTDDLRHQKNTIKPQSISEMHSDLEKYFTTSTDDEDEHVERNVTSTRPSARAENDDDDDDYEQHNGSHYQSPSLRTEESLIALRPRHPDDRTSSINSYLPPSVQSSFSLRSNSIEARTASVVTAASSIQGLPHLQKEERLSEASGDAGARTVETRSIDSNYALL